MVRDGTPVPERAKARQAVKREELTATESEYPEGHPLSHAALAEQVRGCARYVVAPAAWR